MNATALSKEVALRVGLAARELPGKDVGFLLNILIKAVGQPITLKKLTKLRKTKLLDAATGELDSIDLAQLNKAVGFLKGRGISLAPEPLPPVSNYSNGDMPGSIRIACTSNSGDNIDGHFGSCKRFLIYQVSANEMRLIDIRTVPEFEPDDDKNTQRAHLIEDCNVLCTASIGGPATAKVVRAGLHPMKLSQVRPAPEMMKELQSVLRQSPPPWLAKIMGTDTRLQARFSVGVGE